MNKKIMLGIGVVIVLLIFGGFFLFSDNAISNKLSPISIVTLNDENSSIIITKNNIAKTATINMEMYIDMNEYSNNEFMDISGMAVNLGTRMMCGLFSMAFFNETALSEFTNGLNNMTGIVSDENGKELGKAEKNPIEGYNITKVQYYLKDKSTMAILGECLVTGYGSENIKMKINGKEVQLEE